MKYHRMGFIDLVKQNMSQVFDLLSNNKAKRGATYCNFDTSNGSCIYMICVRKIPNLIFHKDFLIVIFIGVNVAFFKFNQFGPVLGLMLMSTLDYDFIVHPRIRLLCIEGKREQRCATFTRTTLSIFFGYIYDISISSSL